MSTLIALGLIGYVIYLHRRLTRLEQWRLEVGDVPHSYGRSWDETPLQEEAELIEPTDWAAPAEPTPVYSEPEQFEEPAILAEDYSEEPWQPAEFEERRPGFAFEEWFGRRLPIWAGGITLAIAGVLIVKLSIDAGLLSPTVRVILGILFGLTLIGAAEAARLFEYRVRDVRVRQALSGAGLASLYASILIAANVYALIPSVVAMIGIAAVTALAMGLAIRFGAPSALLGLAGGLAAPALIGSDEPNVPLLSLYLALAVGGLAALSRSQRWAWLGISALVGGFGWGMMLLLTGALDLPSSISLGLYILLLGVGLPALGLAGDRNKQLQLIAGILASAQMAALVATGGFGMLNWGLFAAIAIASVWLATRERQLESLPPVGLGIALLLLGAWPEPPVGNFGFVLAGTALIYAAMPLRRLWTERGSLLDATQLAVIGPGAWLLSMLQFHRDKPATETPLGLLALGLAAALAAIAGLAWRYQGRRDDARFTIIAVSSSVLLAAAASLLISGPLVGVGIAAVGLALLHVGHRAKDPRIEPFAWIFAGAGLVAFLNPEVSLGNSAATDTARFAMMAALAALFSWRGGYKGARVVAELAAPFLAYGALAPLLDSSLEPSIAPVLLLAFASVQLRVGWSRLVAAMAACALIIVLWAAWPFAQWGGAAMLSLMAEPVLATSVPEAAEAFRRLLIPGLLLLAALRISAPRLGEREWLAGVGLTAALIAIALHSLFKQLFAIASLEQFVALGLAERTVWQILLVGTAALAWRAGQRTAALALAIAAATHFALYTLLLHNPLWAPQHVGDWLILNLLLPSFGFALALTWLTSRLDLPAEAQRGIAIAQVTLVLLFAFSTLRQLFHGSLLVDPGLSQAEDIGRSVLAIALGIGFLLWGIARQERVWRVASLGLMLAAVAKVFLFDASGLEGVVRIASFVALGFSLIGIGWLYARFLPATEPKLAAA